MKARGRSRAVAFAGGLVGLVLSSFATGSARAEGSGPVVISHEPGQQVQGGIELAVRTPAPYVLIEWQPELAAPADYDYGAVVSTGDDGEATRRLSTSGYDGPTAVVAVECTAGTRASCTGARTSVDLDVANTPLAWDNDRWLEEIHDRAAMFGDWEQDWWTTYGFFLDDEPVGMWDTPLMPLMEPEYPLDDGPHTLQAARCRQVPRMFPDFTICDMAHATEDRTFVVRTALHPKITGVRPRYLSPNGDGVRDRATVTLTLETRQYVFLALRAGGQDVADRGLGFLDAGAHTFSVKAHDEDGEPLPSGDYELVVTSISDWDPPPGIDDRYISGSDATGIHVDLVPPKVTRVADAPTWFHPIRDGYRDQVRISGVLSERAATFRVVVRRDGHLVRRMYLGPDRPAGAFAVTWNGRGRDGRVMRPGRYNYWFVARDRAGNRTAQLGGQVEVRWLR